MYFGKKLIQLAALMNLMLNKMNTINLYTYIYDLNEFSIKLSKSYI